MIHYTHDYFMGSYNTIFLGLDGSFYACGKNSKGQLGLDNNDNVNIQWFRNTQFIPN